MPSGKRFVAISIIETSVLRARAFALLLVIILVSGYLSYRTIPRESSPDIQIPIIYISVSLEGVSPEDAERLLIRPLETELRNLDGIKDMESHATLGFASVVLTFEAGFDDDKALQDVREKVDLVKPEFPVDADEPTVSEVNFSLFPVINVVLTADIPDRQLLRIARSLRDELEAIPSVLEVDIAGEREETIDIVADPMFVESYQITADLIAQVERNNRLIAAGAIDDRLSNFQINLPGLIETLPQILELPIKAEGNAIVSLQDIASVQRGFKDATSFARVNGQSALVLEVVKRSGENVIETIDQVYQVVRKEQERWPDGISVFFSQDQSEQILEMVNDLENNVLLAILLVMMVIILFIGPKSSLFIALAIPGALLTGILALALLDLTFNIVVLFSLILSIGMLVDASIVVIEYANRKALEKVPLSQAYLLAAKRMAWPLISSTVTTLMVFFPLLFWPGIVGQFMVFMPITLIAVLSGSLLMALIFIPVVASSKQLGGMIFSLFFGSVLFLFLANFAPHFIAFTVTIVVIFLLRRRIQSIVTSPDTPTEFALQQLHAVEQGKLHKLSGATQRYLDLLEVCLRQPLRIIIGILASVVLVYGSYGVFGKGVEFFPEVEPENAQVVVRGRGNMSIYQKDAILQEVETILTAYADEVVIFYARSGKFDTGGSELPKDTIGVVQLEFADWKVRRKATAILQDMQEQLNEVAGVIIETRKEREGPAQGRPISLQVRSYSPEVLEAATEYILEALKNTGLAKDINSSIPAPAIEWKLEIDREQAARFGVSIEEAGNYVKLISNGLVVTDYRPEDNDEEVDLVLRYPKEYRNLKALEQLRVVTPRGGVPLSNIINSTPQQKVERIERADGMRYFSIEADPVIKDEKGDEVLASTVIEHVKEIIETGYKDGEIDPSVVIEFKGDDEDQKEAQDFLTTAFSLALFGMLLIMVLQFNSFYYALIIMSAVFLSTGGVLLGLMVTGEPYGIVMSGVGIIALAGIVVNNNIILIDTYIQLRKEAVPVKDAVLQAAALRMRPILLTAGTTILGLLPMVFKLTIDFIHQTAYIGAPSTLWWVQLSTSIASGLLFATMLTLFFTPALLFMRDIKREKAAS